MIALIVRHLLLDARRLSLPTPSRASSSARPVHFSNAQDGEDDEFALGRLRAAIAQCGFTDIVFEYEPVAAAYSYEQTLDRDELILIGDFGGGTSDFSILRVGPTERRRGRAREDIVGTDGVAVAGDAFDRQIIRKLVAPRLGLGSEYFSPPDKFLPIPSWPYERLERWHHLSFLNTAKNLEMLEHLAAQRAHPRTARGVRAPHQERNGTSAARVRAAGQVRAVREYRSAVRISLRAGVDHQEGDASRVREMDRARGVVDGRMRRSAAGLDRRVRARHRSRVSHRRIVVRACRAQHFRRAVRVGEDYGRQRADVRCDRTVALRRQANGRV